MKNIQHSYLRLRSGNGFLSKFFRFGATIVVALAMQIVASGYTLVMRGGHRIEIPDVFQLTETSLTYERSPGLLVTLQLSTIDIAATDEANGSRPGSLLRLVNQVAVVQEPSVTRSSTKRARHTLTNLDLEQVRVRRVESEAAYEIRRRELGLPSREETERINRDESERARAFLARSEAERSEAEIYWRGRATRLRNEIYIVDSEIDYIRTRLIELQGSYAGFSYFGVGSAPFLYSRTPSQGPVARGTGSVARSQTSTRPVGTVGVAPLPRPPFNSCRFAPCGVGYIPSYSYYFASYDSVGFLDRLNSLDQTRASLDAQWRILEDEARRAGAQPGWLRP